jgi:hypothetical protein
MPRPILLPNSSSWGRSVSRRKFLLTLSGLALIAVVVSAFFWPVLFAGRWLPRGGGDLVSFIWPMYRFAARSLRNLEIPLWNPYLYSGAPFVADNQSGVFYPVNLLVFFVFGEPSYAVIEGLVIFHVWWAGVSLFCLARSLGLRLLPAVFGGIAYALSDLFVTHIGNLNLVATASWLPLILLLLDRALATERLGYALGSGTTFAVAALAGHAQMLLVNALATGMYCAYRIFVVRRSGWRRCVRTVALTALVICVGLCAAALTLVPAFEMAGHTGRSHLTYDEATRYSLPPKALIGLLAPGFYGRGMVDFWGDWDRVEVGYAGVATLVLALMGVWSWARGGASDVRVASSEVFPGGFFVLLTVAGLGLALGSYGPLYGLLYRFGPTVGQIRAPARLVVLFDLGVAVLAAYGLDRGLALAETRKRAWLAMAVAVSAVLGLAGGLGLARSLSPVDRVSQSVEGVALAATLLATTGLVLFVRMSDRCLHWALAVLLSVDLVGLGSTIETEPNDPTQGFAHGDVVAFLRADRTQFRIESTTPAWQPDAALVHRLFDVGGIYNPLALAPYDAFRWAVGERGGALHNLMGVKYVLASKGEPPGDERLAPVFRENPEIDVYLNGGALPRALLVGKSTVVADHAAAWQRVHDTAFDATREVVLESGGPLGGTLAPGEGSVSFLSYELNEVVLAVDSPTTAYVVLTDVYYPGWEATVDGQPAEVLRADYVYRAVLVGPGQHKIVFRFDPITWRVGLAVSLLTWTGLAAWALIPAIRKRLCDALVQADGLCE